MSWILEVKLTNNDYSGKTTVREVYLTGHEDALESAIEQTVAELLP